MHGQKGVIVGLLKISVFELRIGYFGIDLISGISLFNPALVVLDAPVVFLSEEEDIPVVFDLVERPRAVLIVGNYSLFMSR